MKNQLNEVEMKKVIDIADTITHFRQDCGAFPTIESMKSNIDSEVHIRGLAHQDIGKVMVEDILRMRGEWFDKESVPE